MTSADMPTRNVGDPQPTARPSLDGRRYCEPDCPRCLRAPAVAVTQHYRCDSCGERGDTRAAVRVYLVGQFADGRDRLRHLHESCAAEFVARELVTLADVAAEWHRLRAFVANPYAPADGDDTASGLDLDAEALAALVIP